MISAEEAQELAAEWRPKFVDEADFESSWGRYFDSATVPDAGRLANWLTADLAKFEARRVGVVKEPLLPTRSQFELSDCYHCYGRGFVRLDVPISHAQFGKAQPCPVCSKRSGDPATHCAKCTAFAAESKS